MESLINLLMMLLGMCVATVFCYPSWFLLLFLLKGFRLSNNWMEWTSGIVIILSAGWGGLCLHVAFAIKTKIEERSSQKSKSDKTNTILSFARMTFGLLLAVVFVAGLINLVHYWETPADLSRRVLFCGVIFTIPFVGLFYVGTNTTSKVVGIASRTQIKQERYKAKPNKK